MWMEFDYFNRPRKHSVILCNPNGDELFSLAQITEGRVNLMINSVSEFTFSIPKYKNKKIIPYYDLVQTKRLVKIENIGTFIITNVEIDNDGAQETKNVTCKGAEFELASKTMGLLEGTYKFYDPANTEKSLMSIVMDNLPNWSIGEIDSELWSIHRTFDEKDGNVYNFLMSDVQDAYECVFIFDTLNRKIYAKKVDRLVTSSDIFLSRRNLIKSTTLTEDAENIVTALDVYGDGDLSIHTVNPLGTATIYNFSYYKNTEWMSQDLVDALTLWEEKVANAQKLYSNLLTEIKNENDKLLNLNKELVQLEEDLKVLEQQKAIQVTAGVDLADITGKITVKNEEITSKKAEIESQKTLISNKGLERANISKELAFNKNFTDEQYKELDKFIFQQSYQNTNFSTTDLTTTSEKQDIMQELYEFALKQLEKSSQPTVTFSITAVNFLKLVKYRKFINQLNLGCEVTIEIDKEKDMFTKAVLTGIDISLDDPDDIELTFSNKINLKGDNYTFQDLLDTASSLNTAWNFESSVWDSAGEANAKIDEYINGTLNLVNQEIISSDNQEFVLDHTGLRGREWNNTTQSYSPEQVWLTKNVLAFSDNGFTGTPKQAIGKITLPDGSKAYGVIADAIIGKLLMGKQLTISDQDGTFNINGNLLTIKNRNNEKKVELGEYIGNKFGLKLYNSTGDVVLDEDGILQTWQEGKCDNVASGYPLRLYLYVPPTTKSIRKASLRWKVDKYRAFSTATGGGGSVSTTTDSGGYSSRSTDSGGYTSKSTSSGGETTKTTTSQNEKGGSGGHDHGLSGGVQLATFGGSTTIDGEVVLKKGGSSNGYVTWVPSGSHTHEVSIPSHSHEFTVPNHSHTFVIPSHDHDFTIGSHTHDITYGIYESTLPTGIKITINGTQRGNTYTTDMNDFNIAPYLTIGQWNTIEISSTRLGRIDATCFIQALMSS